MLQLAHLKIGWKLAVGFGALVILALAMGGVALNRNAAMNAQWQSFRTITLAKEAALNAGTEALSDSIHAFKNYVIRGGDYNRKFEAGMAKIEKLAADYRGIGAISEREDKLLKRLGDAVKVYRDGMAKLTAMRAQDASVSDLDKSVAGADKEVAAALNELHSINAESTTRASEQIAAVLAQATRIVLVAGALLAALGIALAVFITRSIIGPLGEAVAISRRVASGDLTSHIEVRTRDETGQLLQALNDMNESLKTIVAEVRNGTDAISAASQQIASGNADLSQRTEEQSSSLEETASSMEELTSTVRQNAENARQANELAAGASTVAVKGGQVVGQVVGTMSSINESSKKIVDIIGVIDGIAFQTNILALNAAVEAARAGEQGRGFAVVASEVRNLAQRSAAAAKEIKALITDSVNKVEDGTRLVDEAGRTMEQIVASVKRVRDIMAEISAASQEQSSGIEQVNQAVTQMDETTQQNAALVEEASAAAESLQEQAQNLIKSVAVFKLAQSGQRAVPSASAPKPRATVSHLPTRAKPAAKAPGQPQQPPDKRPVKVANASAGNEEWQEF